MTFAFEIKSEILTQEINLEEAQAFLDGIVQTAAIKEDEKYIIKINNGLVHQEIVNILNELMLAFTTSNQNKNWIIIDYYQLKDSIVHPSNFFAGVFLGGGSISDINSSSYHLEVQMYSRANALKIQKFLNNYNFKFNLIQRRKLWVLYIKKADQIADFLKAIKVYNSLFIFEEQRINRDFQNQLNRYSNFDVYNQEKLVIATKRFLEAYEYMKKNNLAHKFSALELLFFEMKKNNPYSSLAELTKLFYKKTFINKTRSGFNHWLIKLYKVANDY